MDFKMNRRGQASIFIIIGIAIIVAFIFFFIFKGELVPTGIGGKEISPEAFLESCVEKKVKETVAIMLPQGGYVEPEFSFRFQFNSEEPQDISYLCYNENYYIPCVNQEPMLIEHLNQEIEDYIKEDVGNCFENYVLELE